MSLTFESIGLSPAIVAAVTAAGFATPTPIQERSIPVLLEGKSLVGQAQTGTGKTAAFGLPLLQSITPERKLQALVMVPTRELAVQVAESLSNWSGEAVVPVFGGQPILAQLKALKAGAKVVVGTPGRLQDHMRRGSIKLEGVHFCVLDEADEMLNFGFAEEIEAILAELPAERQLALFSATMPNRIKEMTHRFLPDAVRIEIKATSRTVDNVNQSYVLVPHQKKAEALGRILDFEVPGPTMVFCRTRIETQTLAESLRGRGYPAEPLHGDMAQAERDRVMERFRNGQCQLLVATDVAARGLDIETVTYVINYDIPWDIEQYVHRVGRTARAGRSGSAITLVEPRERRSLGFIEKASGAPITARPVPTREQIHQGRLRRFQTMLEEQMQETSCLEQMPLVRLMSKEYDPQALAAAAMQALWQRCGFAAMDDHDDAAFGFREREPRSGVAQVNTSTSPLVWLNLSVGRRDGIRPGDLVGAVTNECGLSNSMLGKIHIDDVKSFVEVPMEHAERVIVGMRRARLKGKRIKIDIAPKGPEMLDVRPRNAFAGKGGPGPRKYAKDRT